MIRQSVRMRHPGQRERGEPPAADGRQAPKRSGSSPASGSNAQWLTVRRSRLLRWRAKCFGLCEVDAIDYVTHPAHTIQVTAGGWRPGHPAHLTPEASHPPAAGVGSQLAAIPAQAPIAFLLASAHCVSSTASTAPRQSAYLAEDRPPPLIHPPGGRSVRGRRERAPDPAAAGRFRARCRGRDGYALRIQCKRDTRSQAGFR